MARHKGKVPFDVWVKTFQETAKTCKAQADATGKRGLEWLKAYRECMKEHLRPKYEELKKQYAGTTA